MGLGGLICNVITYIKLLHRNCYHTQIFRTYYIPCQKHNNNNSRFLPACVTTQNHHCNTVLNELKRVHMWRPQLQIYRDRVRAGRNHYLTSARLTPRVARPNSFILNSTSTEGRREIASSATSRVAE